MEKKTLSDFLKSINTTKENVFNEAENTNDRISIESEYSPFVINRCLSYFPDTIFIVEELNKRPNIPKYYQYLFLINIVRKRSRFKKWDKIESQEDIKVIREYYNYGYNKALEVLKILSVDQIKSIKLELETKRSVK